MSLDDVTAVKIGRPIFLGSNNDIKYKYIYVDELVTTHTITHTRERFYYLVRITYARTSVQTINKSVRGRKTLCIRTEYL